MPRLIRSLGALAGLIVLVALTAPSAAADDPLRVIIEIGDDGYICTEGCDLVDDSQGEWLPVLDVPFGSLVELHFIWAHDPDLHPFEEHVMRLDGYGVSTRTLDRDNREATLRFIADQPGTFDLRCDLDCDLHDYMQRAQVSIVRTGGTGGGVDYTPTAMVMRPPASEVRGFDTLPLQVSLTDVDGEPLEQAEVRFYLETEFGGVQDLVYIGSSQTDEFGAAAYLFRPFTSDPEQRLVARFAGLGVYDGSEVEIRLPLTSEPAAVYTPEATGFEQIRGLTRVAVVATFLAVWGALAFVVIQAVRLGRAGGGQ